MVSMYTRAKERLARVPCLSLRVSVSLVQCIMPAAIQVLASSIMQNCIVTELCLLRHAAWTRRRGSTGRPNAHDMQPSLMLRAW